jgi:hypothetical protein
MQIFWLISILALPTMAADWDNPYSVPYEKPSDDYMFRPQTSNNARSIVPPDYPVESFNYGSFQTRRIPPPQFTVEISNARPYVRENVILTFQLISINNVERMDPVLPQTQAVTFQILHDPIASNHFDNGQIQIVNTIRYMVTPLLSGNVTLQFSINATVAGYGQQNANFTIQAPNNLNLDIQPQVAGVNPWLPLEQLAITSNIDTPPEVEPGESVALVLRLVAAGALGNQLPSLERLLRSSEFRVYRGKTEWEGGPSEDFSHIMGTRSEHYTLVPQYGGALRLPPIRVTWFNVRTNTLERSTLSISGSDFVNYDVESNRSGISSVFASFWLITLTLLMLIMLVLGYWIGVSYGMLWWKKPLKTLLPIPNAPLTSTAIKLWRISKRLSPRRYLHRIVNRLAQTLPLSIRFWLWVRSANVEHIPALWRKTLQFLSWRALARSPYITCQDMAELIIRFNPAIEPIKLKQLLKTLDSATYGEQSIDFEVWKRDFERQIRPGFLTFIHLTKHTPRKSHLLPLNPE